MAWLFEYDTDGLGAFDFLNHRQKPHLSTVDTGTMPARHDRPINAVRTLTPIGGARNKKTSMPAPTAIAPETVQAYLETEYRVLGDTDFVLRVGEASAELLAAHSQHGVNCSAFLTACNPFSQTTPAPANAARQAELVAELEHRSLAFVHGLGQHPTNGWPGEDSVLVLGLALEAAKVLATRFEQNAFVWSGADGVPQLVLLR